MPDLILHDIEPDLLDRVRRLADTRGCSLEASLLDLLQQGLACARQRDNSLDDVDARVLREAIAALESVPSDSGFALIGRTASTLPAVDAEGPDQTIAPAWMQH